MALTVAELAQICDGTVSGDTAKVITGANAPENATASELAFAASQKALAAAERSQAGCLLAPSSFTGQGAWSLIRVPEPRIAFARALLALYPPKQWQPAVHATAVIAASARWLPRLV